MFRRIHIRTKLVAALAIPVVALVGVSALEVTRSSSDADAVRAQSSLATSSLGPGSLVTSLQDERNFAGLELIGLHEATDLPVSSNDEARANVDEAAADLSAVLAGEGPEVRQVFADAVAGLDGLADLRDGTDAYDGPRDLTNTDVADAAFAGYTEVIDAFFDATTRVALETEDLALRHGVELIDHATRQAELRARIVRRIAVMALTDQAEDRAGLQEVAALYDRAAGYDAAIARAAQGPFAAIAEPVFAEEQVQRFNAQVEAFLASGEVDLAALLDSVRSDPETGYTGLRNQADELLRQRADQLVADAEARQRALVGLVGLVLVLAAAVTWVASRSITRPLRSLTGQAEAMAGERLPAAVQEILDTPPGQDVAIPVVAPVEVRTRDEVREVAHALNVVQRSALDLAVEQAVLRRNIADSFVNLGRRNQNLLSRQLELITDLERDETDPDALEGLFRLDHLATRMRRNAESLLVLAGVEPPRQWAAPVAMSDVVRAALGEVEDYQRVTVRHLEPVAVTGSAAADLAHVVAELIENGLAFSPGDQPVEVKGRLTPAGYTLAVTDNGLGMSEPELARANRRLAGEESFTVAPSRYLGHYVAGHLAARLGVTVELGAAPAGGTTARIDVPMALIAEEELDPVAAIPAVTEPAPAPVPLAPADGSGAAAGDALDGVEPVAGPVAGHHPETADEVVERWLAESQADAPSPAPAPAGDLPHRRTTPDDDGEWRIGDLPEERAPEPAPWSDEPAPNDEAAALGPVPVEDTPVLAWAEDRDGAPLLTPPDRGVDGPAEDRDGAPLAAAPGFGGLAADGAGELPRRVPGAQRPDQPVVPAGPVPSPASSIGDDPPPRSTAEDVYAFLSSFQSGVERGQAEAGRAVEEEER